jgi:hypothetical protein
MIVSNLLYVIVMNDSETSFMSVFIYLSIITQKWTKI